jgi:uncharacterized protein YndB with AHSA1/START domain
MSLSRSLQIGSRRSADQGAFVDLQAILKWLPPKGSRATLEAFEPREGGAFCMKLVFDGPQARGKTQDDTDVVRGTFERLVPGQSITQRFSFVSDDPSFAGTMTMQCEGDRVRRISGAVILTVAVVARSPAPDRAGNHDCCSLRADLDAPRLCLRSLWNAGRRSH